MVKILERWGHSGWRYEEMLLDEGALEVEQVRDPHSMSRGPRTVWVYKTHEPRSEETDRFRI